MTEITDTAWKAGLGPDLDAVSAATPLVINLDSTFTETHGAHKDGTERRHYQGMHGYFPLLAVEASTGETIAAMLRGGNTAASGVDSFTSDTLKRVRRLAGNDTAVRLSACARLLSQVRAESVTLMLDQRDRSRERRWGVIRATRHRTWPGLVSATVARTSAPTI